MYIASKLTELCVKVKEGDRLGVYLEGSPGAVAYHFDEHNPMALGHIMKDLSKPVKVNNTVLFDPLAFPYDFSMTAYLDTGKWTFSY